MPVATTEAQVAAYINSALKQILNEIAIQTTEELMNTVWTDWYMSNNATYYNATGQLLDSIVSSNVQSTGSGFEVEIYMDAGKLSPRHIANSFSEHMGFDRLDFTEGLIEVVEKGNPSHIYPHSGIGMFKKTSKWLEKSLPRIAKKVFSSYGLKVVIT